MARSRAEDQRGFVAAEQGASQSAGRGRRDCDCLRREAPRELAGSAGQGEGSGVGGAGREKRVPAAAGGEGVNRRTEWQEAHYPASLSHPKRQVTGSLGRHSRKEREEARLDLGLGCPCQRPLLHPAPLPPAWGRHTSAQGGANNLTVPLGALFSCCPALCTLPASCTPGAPPRQVQAPASPGDTPKPSRGPPPKA